MQQILPPEHSSPVPDKYTKTGMPDHTGRGNANGRVLHIDLYFLKYGTDDQVKAVALMLTCLMIIIRVVLTMCSPSNTDAQSFESLLDKAILIAVGVALGQSIPNRSD
jgi:hypothetical protein